ncbi:Uncharacterized protein (Fragment) [Durusdinium trenchii]|uniref:Auto-transporter adhesin head GIN domain-containing protein n=1 Tax=Durusdinium trenchii TaxID=1381693 RepID=A0ABP0RWE0_9DINO
MPLLLTVLAELLLCASHALAELRVERVESSHAVSHAWADRSDARPLREDCEVISFTDLCERQLSSGECFKLQPSTSPASCQLWGPAFPAPAQLQGDAAAQGVVTTCGTRRKLHISGQIEMISLRLEAETMIFEDAQVEAWHETPDLSIDQGGAFFSGGPFNLTRSNLTVKSTGAVKGGALAAAGDLTLVSSSLRVLNAAAAESGGGFYGEGTLRHDYVSSPKSSLRTFRHRKATALDSL